MTTTTAPHPSLPSLPSIRVPELSRPNARARAIAAARPLAEKLFIAGVYVLVVLLIIAGLTACAGRTPPTRYYDLATPPTRADAGGPVLALDLLGTDDAYDDERIVYRTSPYRLDYYDYHRWSAPPGVMIGNYLERGLEASGLFGGVVREPTHDVGAILGGRVVAIEEVDVSDKVWQGHVVLELQLVDPRSGDVLWSGQYEERQPLTRQTPEGLAEAISVAMERIVDRAAPQIHDKLAEHLASAAE